MNITLNNKFTLEILKDVWLIEAPKNNVEG